MAPRETVGVDIDPGALRGQQRETHAADMRDLPLADDRFSSVICVQAIEHVPNPERILVEAARVLKPGGRALFVTPNRLTFGRPDEVIDPYHFVEFDPEALRELCLTRFATVELLGLYGSDRYQSIVERERRELERALALDPLRLRRLVPRRVRQLLYDRRLTRSRKVPLPGAGEISREDFSLQHEPLDKALDLIAVCDLD